MVSDGTTQTVHGPQGVSNEITGGTAAYPLQDGLGSTRAWTNSAGTATGSSDWDVWGNPVARWGMQSSLGWAGELTDTTTSQVYLRARDYSPGTGRFTSRDSLQQNGSGSQGYQPYGYADLNPTTLGDPTGHRATYNRCVICTPLLAGVVAYFMTQQQVLAARAPNDLRSLPGTRQWTLDAFALVAAIFMCFVTPACHIPVPSVVDGAIETVTDEMEEMHRDVDQFLREVLKAMPDPQPNPKEKPEPKQPPVPLPDPTSETDRGPCKLSFPFSRHNFRQNLACVTSENYPAGPPGDDAHHIFPRKFEAEFAQIFWGDRTVIHSPYVGQWWERSDHRSRATAYNYRWETFLFATPHSPDARQTFLESIVIMTEFAPIPRANGV